VDVVNFKRDMDVSYQCGKGSLKRSGGGRGGEGRRGWDEDEEEWEMMDGLDGKGKGERKRKK
jgi:hypothetical protein